MFKLINFFMNFIKRYMPYGSDLLIFLRKNSFISFLGNSFYTYYFKRFAKKNNKSPTKEMIKSREYFSKNEDRIKNITSFLYDDESKDVFRKMIDFRCNSNIKLFPDVNNKQYFWNEHFAFSNNEVLIDCGAYYGDTIESFKKAVKHFRGNIKRIIAFEPEVNNFKLIEKYHKDVIAVNAGVGDIDGFVEFYSDNGSLSSSFKMTPDNINSGGGGKIPIKCIDNIPECKEATIIKMDIEGYELKALNGAKNIISTYKPKLAICIYHSDEDMLEIPEWIHNNFPEYKLFIRQHYKYIINETVLYAF
ncbi:MAG: FkbM family methyltransferase [Treponema sp.]|nr:FkbM family methyltransferase [Treponema sp.]MCL2271282.1 FkbM family methyltransferase [Treponema sp.]